MGQSIFELLCENQRLIQCSSDNSVGQVGPLGSRNQDRITSATSMKDKEERRASGHKNTATERKGGKGDWVGEHHTASLCSLSLQGQ